MIALAAVVRQTAKGSALAALCDIWQEASLPGQAVVMRSRASVGASCCMTAGPFDILILCLQEVHVHGLGGLRCQHFQAGVHLVLRTLVERLGVTSFNVAITGHNVAQDGDRQQPVIARQAELS